MYRTTFLSFAALALAGCQTLPTETAAVPDTGAVSAADPRAQAAGEEILRRGGSATDAAIAVMLALTVVEPQSSGIGGGGFLVRGEADGDVTTYDGRETAPMAASPEWFLDEKGEVPPFMESVQSGLSVGVPGNIALAAKAHAAHGRLAWAELFEPAIAILEEGFVVNPRLNASLSGNTDRAGATEEARAVYFEADGSAKPVGSRILNPALLQTMRRLARSGPVSFYGDEPAIKLALAVDEATPRRAGRTGAMTVADIQAYDAKTREAACSSYRAYRVCSMGPPTSGGVAVQQILGQLERFDLAALGVDNPVTWHLFLESQRLAYADREIYLADPDFVKVPVAGLLDPGYLAQRSELISADTTLAEVEAGTPPGALRIMADGDEPEEKGTSHFAVVDSEGTMVSYTSTVEGPFGSGLFVDGFFLNNELTDFSRSPVVDGREVANRVEGGKRPRSSMAPTIIYDPEGEPFMVVGAAGGSTIPVQTARSIIGAIDFGLSAQDALGLPFVMAFGDRVLLEEATWLEGAADSFKALGHDQIILRAAPVKGGALLRRNGAWQTARDPRLEGQVELP